MLQKKIDTQSIKTVRWYSKEPDQALPVPVLGPDIMDPRQYARIKEYTQQKLVAQQEAEAAASEQPTQA
jgi:hypothetical protein